MNRGHRILGLSLPMAIRRSAHLDSVRLLLDTFVQNGSCLKIFRTGIVRDQANPDQCVLRVLARSNFLPVYWGPTPPMAQVEVVVGKCGAD
jgi:hypothetical protein